MKKVATAVATIFLALGFAFAGEADPSAAVLYETSLPAVSPVMAILSSAAATPEPAALAETLLPVANLLPLMSMDLYPAPGKAQSVRDYSAMNFNPKAAVMATPSFRPRVRLSGLSDTVYDLSLVSYLALNVADFISTHECLKYPGLSEGNPLMKPFVKNPYAFAAVKAGLSAVTYVSMKKMYKRNKPMAWVVSIASNLALSYVVSNNFRLLQQAKARVS